MILFVYEYLIWNLITIEVINMYLLQFFFSYETIKYIIMPIVNKNLLWLCLNRYILHLFMDKVWQQTWLQPKTTASLNTHTHTHTHTHTIIIIIIIIIIIECDLWQIYHWITFSSYNLHDCKIFKFQIFVI